MTKRRPVSQNRREQDQLHVSHTSLRGRTISLRLSEAYSSVILKDRLTLPRYIHTTQRTHSRTLSHHTTDPQIRKQVYLCTVTKRCTTQTRNKELEFVLADTNEN